MKINRAIEGRFLFPFAFLFSFFYAGNLNARTDTVSDPVIASLAFFEEYSMHREEGNDSLVELLATLDFIYTQEPVYSLAGDIGEEEFSGNVLDYLASVYSAHDFYETGYWGKPSPERSQIHHWYKKATIDNAKIPFSDNKDFHLPAEGIVTSGYGYRQRFHRMHKGIDIALDHGDTVKAALPGIVKLLGYEPAGYGMYLIILHSNGLETRYGHLSEWLVKEGSEVTSGQPIGLGGTTGNSTGPHLHFETRITGRPVDPRNIFDFSAGKR